jgi:hypothetical protein
LTAVISAPGTTAPLGSVINPLICAFEDCAMAGMHPHDRTASKPATAIAVPRLDAAFFQIDSMALEASEAAGFQGTHALPTPTALTHSPHLEQ